MRILVDSTFVIDYLRGDQAASRRWREAFEGGDEPIVNEIVVCEVATGLKPWEVQDLDAFLEPVEFIQPAAKAALLAGRWRAEVRAGGSTLGLADALIAAAAYTDDAAVLTRNIRDFARTPVRLITY